MTGVRPKVGTALLAGAAAGGLALAAHAAPMVTAIAPVRRRLWPALSGIGDRGHIALTFDDGPDPRSTPAFLDLLDRCRVRATFFLLGRMLARSPGLGRELVAAGHEVALHGHEHALLLKRPPGATRDDLTRGFDLVTAVCGRPPRWYRPPYGVATASALRTARSLGMTPVLWTAWGRDWTRRATPGSVLRTVTASLTGGGTILLHDSDCTAFPGCWKATLGALPTLIHAIGRLGYAVGPLDEHGVTASPAYPRRAGEAATARAADPGDGQPTPRPHRPAEPLSAGRRTRRVSRPAGG